jgi:hypothetical protein
MGNNDKTRSTIVSTIKAVKNGRTVSTPMVNIKAEVKNMPKPKPNSK